MVFCGLVLLGLTSACAQDGTSVYIYCILVSPVALLTGLVMLLAPGKYWEFNEKGIVYSPQVKRLATTAGWIGLLIGLWMLFGYYHLNLFTRTYHVP